MLTEMVTHYCPQCGKHIEYPYKSVCKECGHRFVSSTAEDILIVIINRFRLLSWKNKGIIALIAYFLFPGVNTEAGQLICLALFAIVVAAVVFFITNQSRAKLFIWMLNNDYRDKTIKNQSSFYTGYSTASAQYIMSLTPRQFESYVADVFRNLNYDVTLTPSTADGGKDLVLRKNGIIYYVECKQWDKDSSIGRPVLQKLIGAAVSDGVTHVIFVTTCKYAKTAIDTANENQMVHVDLWGMNELLQAAEQGKRVPTFKP